MTPEERVRKYAQLKGVDQETADAVIAAMQIEMPKRIEKPREKLAYCSLQDVINFSEANK